MFSSSTNNKSILLRGIELLASNAPDSERQLIELLKNSKDLLRIDYFAIGHPSHNNHSHSQHTPHVPQNHNPRQMPPAQMARNPAPPVATSFKARPPVEPPVAPKSKMMMMKQGIANRNPLEPVAPRPKPPAGQHHQPPQHHQPQQHSQQQYHQQHAQQQQHHSQQQQFQQQQQPYPPRPAQKQAPVQQSINQHQPQQTQQHHQPHHQNHHSSNPHPQPLKKRPIDEEFYSDKNNGRNDPPSDDEQDELFPVKKKRPRAVVY